MTDAIKKAVETLDILLGNVEQAPHPFTREEKLSLARDSLTALKQLMENGGWLPLSEAPRDGTKIDVLNPHGERTTDVWFEGGQWKHWWISDYDGMGAVRLDIAPTHFRLIPAPPPPLNSEGEA